MKTHSRQDLRRFQLKIMSYGNSYYIDRIAQLERALARKPRVFQIDMVGVGEIPADSALTRALQFSADHGERLGTRAIDLLHVACALALESELFLTTDNRQAQLAKAEGLKVILSTPRLG